jgi:type I restriction enzyme S subunit
LKITREEAKKLGSRIVPKNSVIISCVGELGLLAIAGNEIVINQQLHAFIPKEKIYFEFLFFALAMQKRYLQRISTKTAVPYLNKDNCNSISIPLPPFSEQKKISVILSSWNMAITKIQQLITQLQQRNKGLMQQVLTSKNSKKEVEQKWHKITLGSIVTIKKGQQKNKADLLKGSEFPVINGGIEPSGYTDEWNANADTITISEGGNSCGYVNYLKERFWSGGHCYTLENLNSSIHSKFLYWYLKFNEPQIMLLRVGSGLPNIQLRSIQDFPVKLPIFKVQKFLAAFFDSADYQLRFYERRLAILQRQKKGLAQKLLSGETRVKV